MYKKKPFFVVFEGIEGSGKSYHSKKLFKKVRKLRLPSIITREPSSEKNIGQIRKILLSGKINKFDIYTDTFLYLASRNEHIKKVLLPALSKKKIVICDRFSDSTLAYQVRGFGVNEKMINTAHKTMLKNLKVNLTFILKLNVNKSLKRVKMRKGLNRYDKFSMQFYNRVQRGFLKIAKKNKKRYVVLDSSKKIKLIENIIYDKFKLHYLNDKK